MDGQREDDPVFVDRTGRRRRLTAIAGSTGGLLLTLVLLALVAGFTGAGPVPVPGWPQAAADGVRGTRPKPLPSRASPAVGTPPATARSTPAARTPTSGPGSAAPVATPTSPATGITPTPSVSVTRTPKKNGRRPTHTPNPHSTKKG